MTALSDVLLLEPWCHSQLALGQWLNPSKQRPSHRPSTGHRVPRIRHASSEDSNADGSQLTLMQGQGQSLDARLCFLKPEARTATRKGVGKVRNGALQGE